MNVYTAPLGDEKVLVRFAYEPECLGHGAHPDHYACVTIEEVCIGGVWIASNLLNDEWCARTEELILADIGRSLKEEHDCAAWEAQEERRMEEGYP